MDIQNILNIAIQVIVMGFVSFMVFDFVDGLWDIPLPPASWQPPVIEPATAPQPNPQQEIPQLSPASAPQFEEIPDPWTTEPQSPQHCLGASAVVPFPTLRLLPPAKVQPSKPKRTKAKSSTPRKSSSTPKRQSTKSRKKAA